MGNKIQNCLLMIKFRTIKYDWIIRLVFLNVKNNVKLLLYGFCFILFFKAVYVSCLIILLQVLHDFQII